MPKASVPPPAPTIVSSFDVIIVGAGPGGIHAALKTALLYHTALLIDKGQKHGRIFYAREVWNLPGFERPVTGVELLRRQREQIRSYERAKGRTFVTFWDGREAVRVRREEPAEDEVLYTVEARDLRTGRIHVATARNLVLATGVVDRQPVFSAARKRDIDPILPYANKGLSDYCLLCDGHALEDKTVAVLGCGVAPVGLALALRRHFRAQPTVVFCRNLYPNGTRLNAEELDETRAYLAANDLPMIDKDVVDVEGLRENRAVLVFADGTRSAFDRVMIDLGWHKLNHELAVQLGGELDPNGAILTTDDNEVIGKEGKPIHGLFAVGDVRSGSWNQIPIVWGEAETAVIHAFAEHL